MITIKEMADMLGVSTTTVSNVIHGKVKEVSKETVEKVQQLLVEYDYVPNINARNLAQNQSKIIGIAMKTRTDKYENLLADPFFGELVGAVEKTLREYGYFMMLYISDDINEIIRYISTWNADGLILAGMPYDGFIRVRGKCKKPMVMIDSYNPREFKNYVNIGLQDAEGMYEMTKYLLSMGHQKIGFVTDNLEGVDYYRYQGFEKAMEEHGLCNVEDSIIMIRPGEDERGESLNEIYCLTGRFTAFLCMSDYYAVTIMDYLIDHGVRIPEDISITGCDDNMLGKMIRPALTTIHQDVEMKGQKAVETLVRIMRGEEVERDTRLPFRLMIRDSVKNLNA